MSSLHFDPHQFAGRRSRPVQTEYTQDGWTGTGVAYEDFARMHTRPSSVSLRDRRWIPAFSASNEKLRRVLLNKAWSYITNRHTAPPDDWKNVNAAATKKALELFQVGFKQCPLHKKGESQAHVAAVKHAGGYLELLAAIAYRAWRFREDSVTIAEALHSTPQAVRVNLQRLCNVARQLGYETFERHSSFQRQRPKLVPKDINQWLGRIIGWYKQGRPVSQIAQAIGYPKGHGNNRVRHVLMNAGIYKGAKPRCRARVN